MNKNGKIELVQWGYELIKNAYLNKSEDIKELDSLYLDYLYPYSEDFYSLTNSLMIFGGQDFKEFSGKPSISVRDGLIPLSIFFMEMDPANFTNEIYIHKDFWFVVPENWRPKVKFYEVKSKNTFSSANPPKKIFVAGLLNSTFSDPDEFDEYLKSLGKVFGQEKLKEIEILAYFPDKRNDLWGSWEEENVLRYSSSVFKHLKMEVSTPMWVDIKTESSFEGCLYYEVNNGLFIRDSFITHFALARGAGFLESTEKLDERFKLISEVPCSLYHSYSLYEFDFKKADSYEDPLTKPSCRYLKRLLQSQNKGIRMNYKWEEWYATYLKRYYKSKLFKKQNLFDL